MSGPVEKEDGGRKKGDGGRDCSRGPPRVPREEGPLMVECTRDAHDSCDIFFVLLRDLLRPANKPFRIPCRHYQLMSSVK